MTNESTTEEKPKPAKVATRPGSQWATGKRRVGKHKSEPKGFARGARTK